MKKTPRKVAYYLEIIKRGRDNISCPWREFALSVNFNAHLLDCENIAPGLHDDLSISVMMDNFYFHLSQTSSGSVNSTVTEDNLDTLRTFEIVNCVLNGLLSITAALGNGIMLFAILKTPALHSPSNTLLFGLALTDFFVGLVTQPLKVASCVIFLVSKEDAPLALRNAFDILSIILTAASFLTATAISVDRYLVFYLHMKYQVVITNKKVMVIIAFSWLISILFGFIWTQNTQAYYLIGIIASVISFSIMVLMYYKIYRVVRRHRAQIQSQAHVGVEQNASSQLCFARSAKSAMNTFYVCFILFLCFFPYNTTACVIQLTGSSLTKYIVLQYTGTITFLNSSLNPLVYFWRIGEIRAAIKNTLKSFRSREVRREQSEETHVWVGKKSFNLIPSEMSLCF